MMRGKRQVREDALPERLASATAATHIGRKRPSMAEQRSKRGRSGFAQGAVPELLGHPVDSASLLLYGVVEVSASMGTTISGVGLDDEPLQTIVEGPLAAIVSRHMDADGDPAPDRLREYERTVCRLMERDAILPARFGSVLADEGAVRGLLRRRHRDLLERVQRVAGAVELALRATWRVGAGMLPASGTSYLRERLELRQSAREVASELDPLTALARSSRRTLGSAPDLPVLDAYLVERDRVREFVAMVAQLDDRLDDVELTCTGPWPPYSFADGAPV
jgi:Gas vesicle synthesis protein GvpL/GvpF